jgi:hypothetical protein
MAEGGTAMHKSLIALALVVSGAPAFAQAPLPQGLPPALQGPAQPLSPGLYVQVIDGLIHVGNSGGSQVFAAGQFGYVPSANVPPVIVPNNPGLQFVPPPVFNTGGSGPSAPGGGNPGAVDCEVR